MAKEEASPALKVIATLSGHEKEVWGCHWCVEPSTNRIRLATCSADRTVRIWGERDTKPWCCLQTLDGQHTKAIRAVCWSPTGRELACAGFDSKVSIWKIDDIGELVIKAELEGHANEIKSVAWTEDARLLCTSGRDKQVWIWEADDDDDHDVVAVLNGHTQDVKMARWQPGETQTIASCSYDNTIIIWVAYGDDWYAAQTLEGHTDTVWAITFNPHNKDQLASCSSDRTICIWSYLGEEWILLHREPDAHKEHIYSVQWVSEDLLLSTGADSDVKLWRLVPPSSSGDGGYMLSMVATLTVCTAELNGAHVCQHGSKMMVSVCSDDGNVYVLEIDPG